MKILFLGAPGSGKSTQGQFLAEDKGFEWISSGQLFRESNDPKILEIVKGAELVPDEITERMIMEAMEGKEKVILDGFPRNLAQCEFLAENEVKIDLMLEIVVPDEELLKRMLLRGRGQDTEEVAKERIKMYHETRDMVVEFFQARGVELIEIDGVGTIEEVKNKIREAIK